MDSLIWLAPALAVVALLFAFYKISFVSKQDAGTDRMKEISSAISDGARAFLFAEYRILAIFVAVLFIAIGFGLNSWITAVCFLCGAAFSILAGYIGMNVATKANVRTANAARESGMNKALSIAFSGGSVMGMCVVGLGLLGASVLYLIFNNLNVLFGFSLGASSIALFAVSAAVSTPKQPMLVLTSSVRSRQASPRMTLVTPLLSLTMSATMSAMSPVWVLTCLRAMSVLSSPQ